MHRANVVGLALVAALTALAPAAAGVESGGLAVQQDRLYRLGVFLVIDAVLENRTPDPVGGIEAAVELYDFFDELVGVEPAVVRPLALGPGHVASLRAVTPWSDAVRRVRYRFTWRRGGELVQTVVRREVWAIGQATRPW
jgi:hypothetical protein